MYKPNRIKLEKNKNLFITAPASGFSLLIFCKSAILELVLNNPRALLRRPILFTYSDIQIFRYSNIQIFRYSDIQIFRYSDIQIFRYSDIQIFR